MKYNLVRERRKTLIIKILENGDVLVKSPKKCSINFIEKFIESKTDWINKAVQNIKNQNAIYEDFLRLNSVMIFGQKYMVVDDGKKYIIGEYYVIKHTMSSNKLKHIKSFIMSIARNYIEDRCRQLSFDLNLKYKSIEIVSSRTKWGSCNGAKQLKFNFRLACLPKELIDYVICHELFHTKELNHSKKFWDLLKEINYDKKEIKEKFKPFNFVLKTL